MKKLPLSVVIITKNEEDMIEGALKSVSFAQEIIVVDTGSSDKTTSIAKKYTKKVFSNPWKGFASQKNVGIRKATKDWILILDADERVSQKLSQEITRIIEDPGDVVAFDIPFRNFFLGKEMKHGGWQGETHIRLFRRGKAIYKEQEIHEYLEIDGTVAPIQVGSILHFSHRDIASNLLKTRQYALVQSEIEAARGYPPVTRKSLFSNIISHFWLRYITLEGYKDGMEGFVEATYQAFSQIFVIQSMIWERQRGKTVKELYKKLEQDLMADAKS